MELHLREVSICTHSRNWGILSFNLATWSLAILLQNGLQAVEYGMSTYFFHKKT